MPNNGMNADDRLQALFAQDEPPARDLGFTLAVMEKVARRRLMLSLAMLALPTLLAMLVLWAVAPAFQPLFESVAEGVWPAVPAAILAGFLALLSWQLLAPAEH
jgi:hypothetical protein